MDAAKAAAKTVETADATGADMRDPSDASVYPADAHAAAHAAATAFREGRGGEY
jgi:hypothetical protein